MILTGKGDHPLNLIEIATDIDLRATYGLKDGDTIEITVEESDSVSTEYLDLYDQNRNPLGRTVARGTPIGQNEYIVAVGIWVINDRNEILVTRRALTKRFMPGKWENPAGHVMAGEAPTEAIIRELHEETGLAATPESIHFLGTATVWPYFGDNYCVRLNADISEVVLCEGETIDAKWVSIDAFERMAETGEMASSVIEHMDAYRDAFYRAVGR